MPPVALMSVAAWSTPFFICAPVAAFGPVIGPPTPNLTWAAAVPAVAIAMLKAKPNVVIFFMVFPLETGVGLFICRNPTSAQFAAPAHCANLDDQPTALRHHLRCTRGPETHQSEEDVDRAVNNEEV